MDIDKPYLTWWEISSDLRIAIMGDYLQFGVTLPDVISAMSKVQFLVEPEPLLGSLYWSDTTIVGEVPSDDPDEYLLFCYDEDDQPGMKYGYRALSAVTN